MANAAFPPDFLWGMATSAFQIEGAAREDGRGESIWDRFCCVPGAIATGENGDVACDHYHRYEEDIRLMAELGVRAYRFSIAWPRILPSGRGRIESRGLDFYNRLVDALLTHGIQPCATLYHWDLPQALQDAGGWPQRRIVDAFTTYADATTRALGDRVKLWFTHNEPWCIAILGHARGEHAPGLRHVPSALAAAHHLLLSHGRAIPVIRANCSDARVGIVLNLTPAYPASASAPDHDAARLFDGCFNRWFLDPLHGRGYPDDVAAHYRAQGHLPSGPIPFVQPGDFDNIATPVDFLGVNYYTREITRGTGPGTGNLPPMRLDSPLERTEMGWEIFPDGLYDLLVRLHKEYQPRSLLLTENGCSYADAPDSAGRIHDSRRISYLQRHLAAARRAMAEGVPLQGYFVWSLLDNFEWQYGYRQRFGLVWVDPQTRRRIPKDSAFWYRDQIAGHGQ